MLQLSCHGAQLRRIALLENVMRTVGRLDVPDAPRSVSLEQCDVTLRRRSGESPVAVLRNRSSNGTLFIPAGDGACVHLRNSASRELREGDSFALCASEPELARVRFVNAQEEEVAPESPAKRIRRAEEVEVIDLTKHEPAADDATLHRPLVLLLSGLVGAGKSTFAAQLTSSSASRWRRVCQDCAGSHGKPGSRSDVMQAALLSLRDGYHVVVDRTHLTVDQRKPFIALATALGCRVHAVELAIPLDVCVQRILKRTNHEGGVEGQSGVGVAHRMRAGKDNSSPSARESFTEVTRCKTDADVARCAQRYATLPPASHPTLAFPDCPKSRLEDMITEAAQRHQRPSTAGPVDAFTVLRQGAASKAVHTSRSQQPPKAAAWSDALCRLADAPNAAEPGVVLRVSHTLVCVRDAFPKARAHVLLIATERTLDNLSQLQPRHEALLVAMRDEAAQQVAECRRKDPALRDTPFAVGFHAVPSMRRLHCHVISRDYCSASLKNKKHWHSFTHQRFFLLLDGVLQQLRTAGRVTVDTAAAEACLNDPLRCHRCGAQCGNMPQLKRHVEVECTVPVPP